VASECSQFDARSVPTTGSRTSQKVGSSRLFEWTDQIRVNDRRIEAEHSLSLTCRSYRTKIVQILNCLTARALHCFDVLAVLSSFDDDRINQASLVSPPARRLPSGRPSPAVQPLCAGPIQSPYVGKGAFLRHHLLLRERTQRNPTQHNRTRVPPSGLP
jgi:hypothetical protein